MDIVSLNGQLVPYEEARVAPGDAGFLHGAGLFETMRSRNGKVFRLGDHLARLSESARILGLEFLLGESELAELAAELLEATELGEGKQARLRLTITRGDMHAVSAENPMPPVTLLLTATVFAGYAASAFEKGMTVAASGYKQSPQHPLTGHKTTSYFDRLLGLRQANAAGAGEALWFTPENVLAEGSISNVFLVDKAGALVTPPLMVKLGDAEWRLCLPGVTRQVVREVAAAVGMMPQERLLTIDDVLAAREIFLTNAVMGVMPVTRVEQHTVGSGKPGEVTGRLREGYLGRYMEETGAA